MEKLSRRGLFGAAAAATAVAAMPSAAATGVEEAMLHQLAGSIARTTAAFEAIVAARNAPYTTFMRAGEEAVTRAVYGCLTPDEIRKAEGLPPISP